MAEQEKIEIRKIVPVIAKISAGKSKLLNVLYNIKFLECKAGIGTQFVNLLRYNPNIKQPCFYHLKISKEGENYIFYKDLSEFYEGEQTIIDANKKINEKLRKESRKNYDNIFYMTEINDSPFIKDKEYLLNHDLCDIPGLSEEQSTSTPKEKNEITNKAEVKDIISEKNNDNQMKEDEIYYQTKDIEKNTYLSEIFGRIKNYIDEGIIIFNVENYQHKDNYELIAKFHKVIGKEISDFLILLNKIDLSTNPQEDIENCRGLIIKYFPRCKTFNLNLNTFIPISLEQVQNELLINKNFAYFFYYLFDNYYSKFKEMTGAAANKQSFISHLKVLIQTYKKIKVNEIKSKVNDLNQKENISEINKEIISIMEYLLEKYKGKEINFGFSIIDFKEDNDDDKEEENSEDEEDEDNFDRLPNSSIIKILYIYYKEKIIIPQISKETKDLLNYFQKERLKIKLDDNINNNKNKKKETKIENYLNSLCGKLKKSKIDINKIQKLINKITDTLEFLRLSDQIFIPILGPSNAGKTTIINGLIGRNILPTDLKECTKRGILISYSDQEDDEISVYKSNFKEGKIIDKPYYYLEEGYKIGKGLKQVNDLLKGLNYEFTNIEEDCFYYIKTRIKLFDELGLNDSIKRQIYLIDFPGYGTDNKFIEKTISKKIIDISSAFIFVLKNSIIKEKKTKQIIVNIFNKTKTQKNKLYSGIIKSCSFILNNDNTQTTNDTDIEQAKKDIQEIITFENNKIDTSNINLSFFNAGYFRDYRNVYIYFFNLEETFEKEYNNYIDNKKQFFKRPELNRKKINSFFDYFINQLDEKLKEKFFIDSKKLKTPSITEEVKNKLNKIFDKYRKLQNINMKDKEKKFDKIEKIFSYGQNKINDLNILKESNIESLKNLLNSQIKFSYNNIKKDIENKIDNILSTLDKSFKEYSISMEEIEDLNMKIARIKEKLLLEIINENKENISKLFIKYKTNITNFLNGEKENLKINLQNDKYKNILKNIDEDLERKQNEIKKELGKILDDINNSIFNFFEKGAKEINEFSGNKIELKLMNTFNDYLLYEIGDKNSSSDLMGQILFEMKCVKNLSKIYNVKGFGNFIKSAFSDYHYIINNIDIILESSLEKIDYITSLLTDNLEKYIEKMFKLLNDACDIASYNFTNEQKKIWKEIGEYYHSNKKQIEQAKNDMLNNYE